MWLTCTALAFVVASGCAGGSQPGPVDASSSGADVTAAPGALTIEVSTDQTTVGPAGRLTVKVTTTNTGKTPVDLTFPTGCQTDYEMLDAKGAVIGQSFQMCTESFTRRTLAPGASFTTTHVWIRNSAGQPKLPAGAVVRFRGVLLTEGAEQRSRYSVAVTLQ
jgi:hypothetical protein